MPCSRLPESGDSSNASNASLVSDSASSLKKSRPCLPRDANSGCPCQSAAVSPPLSAACTGSDRLPQYSALGLSAKICTSAWRAICARSRRYIGASVAMPNTQNRCGRFGCGTSSHCISMRQSFTRCGTPCLPSSKKRQSSACQISPVSFSSPAARLPAAHASIHSGRYTRYWSNTSASCPASWYAEYAPPFR